MNDTQRAERYCCDGKCNDNQGRGGCPAVKLDHDLYRDDGRLTLAECAAIRWIVVGVIAFWGILALAVKGCAA